MGCLRGRFAKISILIILALVCASAFCDEDSYGSITDYLNGIYGIDNNAGLTAFPVLNIPMGGKAESMATAFSAVCTDVSFIEWNPAGSATLANNELAVFHNNWIADTKMDGAVYTTRFDNLGVAAATKWLYTPFTEYDSYGEKVAKGYYCEGVGIVNFSYNFFSNYYFSGFAVGGNLKAAFRFVPDYTTAVDINGSGPASLITGSGESQSAMGILADFGGLVRINFLKFYYSRERNLSFAFVIRNLGLPSMGDAVPTVIVAALSYKPLRPFTFAFDYTIPVNLLDISLSEKMYWSAGLSANMTSFLSVSTGLLMKAGSLRIALGSAITVGALAFDVNYTLDLLTQLQPLNRVSIGIRFNLGDGGRQAKAKRIDNLYLSGLDSYSRGDDDDAKAKWEAALSLDPTFNPAQEGLDAIAGYRELTNRLRILEETEEQFFSF
jgi:hypothetical protein